MLIERRQVMCSGLRYLLGVSAIASSELNAQVNPGSPIEQRILGRWGRTTSYLSSTWVAKYRYRSEGYSRRIYAFLPDGRYAYMERVWGYDDPLIHVFREQGQYQTSGSRLTVRTVVGDIQSFTKVDGADTLGQVAASQNIQAETVEYHYFFHYFPGIQEWNLLLQAPRETRRDGAFSLLTQFQSCWAFDRKYTAVDLTAPRVN